MTDELKKNRNGWPIISWSIGFLIMKWKKRQLLKKWRANEITTDQDKELVRLVSSTLEWKTDRIRAFVVELLENCYDHQVANRVNVILLSKYGEERKMGEKVDCP